jgi:hypothetical protein
MGNGNFITGLEGLAKWLGNLVLPCIAAYCVVLALVAIHRRRDGQRYFLAALLCLMGPALAQLVFAFVNNTPAGGGHDAMYNALLNGINWLGNVIMPMFSVWNVVCGALVLGGFNERMNIGDDWARYFIVAFGGLMVSGIMRLLEWFVTQGQTTTLHGSFSAAGLFIYRGALLWH